MTERKSYGQFCGLARALDHVGDRWTLLIVRELLLGDKSFRELEDALPGIGPSLLTKRLAALTLDGLVERNKAPRRSKTVLYRLTPAGEGLERAVIELVRWGTTWMLTGPGDDHVDSHWAPLALKALLDGKPARRARIHVSVGGVPVTIRSTGRRRVTAGHHGRADAHVAAELPTLLALAAGALTLADCALDISGNTKAAIELLTLPPTAQS